MAKTLAVQEHAIVIATKEHSPAVLTPAFLKYGNVVSKDWELAGRPVCTDRVAQVIYANGISITAEPNRVMFMQPINETAVSESVAEIASKYVQTLSNIEYQGLGHNFRGYISFDNQQDAARKYLSETLLTPGAWQQVGTEPVRATVNYHYTLERSSLQLSVNEAALRQPDEETTPIVLFAGNFIYDVSGDTKEEKLKSLQQAIDNWQVELETFKEIVNNKFLAELTETQAVVPDLFGISASVQMVGE